MSAGRAILHNVTFYVQKEHLGEARAFYAEALGLPIVFEESAHICCFQVGDGPTDVAICIHEEEHERPAGTCELFFYVDEEAEWVRASNLPGATTVRLADGTIELRLVDPEGNLVRLHRRSVPSPTGAGGHSST